MALLIRGKDVGNDVSKRWADADLSACGLFLKIPLGGCWKEDEIRKYDCAYPEHCDALLRDLKNLVDVDYVFIIFVGSVDIKTTRFGSEYECLHLRDDADLDARQLELCSRVTVVMDCCRNCQSEPQFHFEEWMDASGGSQVSQDEARDRFDRFVMDSEEGLIAIHAEDLPQTVVGNDTFTHAMIRSAISWKHSANEGEDLLCVRDATLRARKYLEKDGNARHNLRYDTRDVVRHRHFPFAISL